MSLRAAMCLTRGALHVDVELAAGAGETVALVGPNGAGKSTCLHAVAGLLRIDRGSITCGEQVFDGGPDGPWLTPEARGVGVVFQEHRLFPNMSVADNVAFGLRSRGTPRRAARALAARWLERVGIASCGDAKPQSLSGGQAQRAALARALATSPRLLLLDEPFAAVDASAKLQLRRELRDHLQAFAGVRLVVVHDIGDALALAERIFVLEAGRVVQTGTIADLVSKPKSRYVADLVGINCFRGTCRNGVVELDGGQLVVASGDDGPAIVTVHPRAVALFRERPAGSPRNVWSAPILGIEPSLDRVRVQVGGALPVVAEVTAAAVAELRLADGGDVWVAVKATEITVAPA
jgi:molybdate transport system ATP-binding protein